jgi:3-hydroxy acid dehydrogenase / malonic semialdehyde reductase
MLLKNRLQGKLVLITGASSGIGKACAKSFAEMGANLILAARRKDLLLKLKNDILQENIGAINIDLLELDVRDQNLVSSVLNAYPQLSQVDILINNAGLARGLDSLDKADILDLDTMLATNVNGLIYVTKNIIPHMITRNRGHIINIGSIAGIESYGNAATYCATKAAVHALSKSLRIEVAKHNIRISEIMPGAVNTEFSLVRFGQDRARADRVYDGFEPLVASDIAELILYTANLPEHVNLAETLILPTAQSTATGIARASD